LPHEWANITLRQLLNHTSGIPDYSKEKAFSKPVQASLLVAPPPIQLLSYFEKPEPSFTPGTKFTYSNSDNIIIGLMTEAATGSSYERALRRVVAAPFGLSNTTLPHDANLRGRSYTATSATTRARPKIAPNSSQPAGRGPRAGWFQHRKTPTSSCA